MERFYFCIFFFFFFGFKSASWKNETQTRRRDNREKTPTSCREFDWNCSRVRDGTEVVGPRNHVINLLVTFPRKRAYMYNVCETVELAAAAASQPASQPPGNGITIKRLNIRSPLTRFLLFFFFFFLVHIFFCFVSSDAHKANKAHISIKLRRVSFIIIIMHRCKHSDQKTCALTYSISYERSKRLTFSPFFIFHFILPLTILYPKLYYEKSSLNCNKTKMLLTQAQVNARFDKTDT